MALAPITEEDKPAVEAMIKKLVRFRKRQTENGGAYLAEGLGKAITELHEYGAMKGWWEYEEAL